jgi:glutamine synthetase
MPRAQRDHQPRAPNSYKRLVPGFEAPVKLAYSARNRSASIRIPYVSNPKGRRIEVPVPDPTTNPYLAFSAMLMAGLDGVQNKIHPGDPADKNLYDLPPEEMQRSRPCAAHSTRRSTTWTRTASFLPAAASSPTT